MATYTLPQILLNQGDRIIQPLGEFSILIDSVRTSLANNRYYLDWNFSIMDGGSFVFSIPLRVDIAASRTPLTVSAPYPQGAGASTGTLPDGFSFSWYSNGQAGVMEATYHSEKILASEISTYSDNLSTLTGLPPTIFTANAQRIADDLMAAGVKDSELLALSPKAVDTLHEILPPTESDVRTRLASNYALALGVPLEVVLSVSGTIAHKLVEAYIPSNMALTLDGLKVVQAALGTVPIFLRPPANGVYKQSGCSALGYVWDNGQCFSSDSAAYKNEANSSVSVNQPGPVISDHIVAPPETLSLPSTSTAPPPSFPVVPVVLLGGGAVLLYAFLRRKR